MTASEPRAPDAAPAPEPTPLDRVLDLTVYVPIGLALAARDVLPRLAEAGRRQLGAQLTAARVVGRLAVDQGTRQAGEVIRRMADQGAAVLGGAGRTGGSAPRRDDGFPAPAAPGGRTVADPTTAGPAGVRDVSPAVSGPPGAGTASDLDPAELAIPGYDTLSASQVVQRLPGLSPHELEAVRTYELAGRARKTILLKIAQLRTPS